MRRTNNFNVRLPGITTTWSDLSGGAIVFAFMFTLFLFGLFWTAVFYALRWALQLVFGYHLTFGAAMAVLVILFVARAFLSYLFHRD